MFSEYLDPEDEKLGDEQEKNNDVSADKESKKLESKGPQKDKKFKVLHQDSSLADLSNSNGPGGGSLAGTIGIGT